MISSTRGRHLASAAGLLLFAALAGGSFFGDKEVSIDDLNAARDNLKGSLESVKGQSEETTQEVESAYDRLSTFLREESLNDEQLRTLEDQLETVQAAYEDLEADFEDARKRGEKLFELLEHRADENQTRTLRRKMIRDIRDRQDEFDEQLLQAGELLERIEASIQKYDDIVGYCQVNKGLEGVDPILADIETVMTEGKQLNREIRSHVDEGLSIIEDL